MNPRIYQSIVPIVVAPQTLLTPAMKEVVTDAASGSVWVNRIPRKVIWTGVDGITTGKKIHDVSVKHAPSPVLIGIVANFPPCGLNRSLQVSNKQQSASPALVSNTQKIDAVVDGKLPNDLDYESISSKVIGYKLSNSSIDELYLRCKMNFSGDLVQTQTPQFMDMWAPTITALDKISVLGTTNTRIWRPTDESYWSVPDYVFGEATVVGMSAEK